MIIPLAISSILAPNGCAARRISASSLPGTFSLDMPGSARDGTTATTETSRFSVCVNDSAGAECGCTGT